MSDQITRLTDELKSHLQSAQTVAATAEGEDRDFTDAERDQVNELMAKASQAKKDLEKAKGDASVKAAIRDLGDSVGLIDSAAEATARRDQLRHGGGYVKAGRASVGETFITSDEYADLLKSAPNGMFQRESRVQSRPVGFKDLVTGADRTSAGVYVDDDYKGLLVGPDQFYRPLTLRSLVTSGTTTSDQIEYARITGITSNAAPVPEATTAEPPTADTTTGALNPAAGGGYKPQSGFTAVRVTTPVRTIAHWLPITKRALSDAAQVETLIDNFLQVGLEEELEDQMIAGDGNNENFEGLASVSGTQTQTTVDDPSNKPEGFGNLLAVRRAKTRVRLIARAQANGVVIHPNDLQKLDEISDNQGRFYFGGPAGANGTSPLWGLSVIESEAATEGTAWVGDWRKAILWDREQASITATDSHDDFFVRNIIVILAEMRAAFGVIQPNAFVKVSIT